MKTFVINEAIKLYRYGKPFYTGSVVLAGDERESEDIKYFALEENEYIKLSYKMGQEDIILGLGENLRGINKRGGEYASYCTDESNHTPGKKSLYGAHNFFLLDGSVKFGVFIDFPGRIDYDMGFKHRDRIEIIIYSTDVDIYIIDGQDSRDIVKKFRELTGSSYVPPKWAFGYQQSRWSYPNAEAVEKVAGNFLRNDIPCDAIYLDIDYMEDFKDFTVDEEKFPALDVFAEKMKAKGFRLVPIIDAGVKLEAGYRVYDEGVEKDYFCVNSEGRPFVAAVWPGKCHFPDFLKPEVRQWFGMKYKTLIDKGIEGFWNDMNEPAIFYTERGLKAAVESAKEAEDKNLNIYSFFGLRDKFRSLSNNPEDYKSFYHRQDGRLIRHDDVHNLYGYYMTRAAAEGFEQLVPGKRLLLFSRASCIGMHRYGGIWTGDNHSWWEHLLLNLKMLPSLNMCGFLYCGADTGGFGGDVNDELLIRWMQLSMFTPLFRNHSASGTRAQEPYAFDEETVKTLRELIKLRYALIPYIYSEYMKATLSSDVYCSPLSFRYDDDMSRHVEDQVLIGDSLMIAPVYNENARGRYVWLPEDMLLWRASSWDNRKYEIVKQGHAYLELNIDETPVFVRKNKAIVMAKPAANVEAMESSEITVIAFAADKAEYSYYDDDGSTMGYKNGEYSMLNFEISRNTDGYDIKIDNRNNTTVRKVNFEIIDGDGQIFKKIVKL